MNFSRLGQNDVYQVLTLGVLPSAAGDTVVVASAQARSNARLMGWRG